MSRASPAHTLGMNSLSFDLERVGYLARTSQLYSFGHTRRDIDAAVRAGWLKRPIRSWVATRNAPRDAVIAIMHHGKLTGATALASFGAWSGLDTSIHVAVPPSSPGRAGRSSVPLAEFVPLVRHRVGVVLHWAAYRAPLAHEPQWRVPIVDALVQFARTESDDFIVAAIDSALHVGALPPSDLPGFFLRLPRRLRRLRAFINAKSESGTESLVRFRAASIADTIDVQVQIGPHRVDLLINGWLVIEVNSEEWHANSRVEDSKRVNWLTARGYRVLSFDYTEVMFGWDTCLASLHEMLRNPMTIRASEPRSTGSG